VKIGLMVTGIGVPRGREKNVSGHVQLPMRTAELLQAAGSEVHLITTQFRDDYVLPEVVPDPARVPLHVVADGRRRGEVGKQNAKSGYRPLAMIRQLRQMLRLARELQLDVLHVFGMDRMSRLAGLLRLLGSPCPVISTAYRPFSTGLWGPIYRRSDAVVCSTQYVTDLCAKVRGQVHLIRPGIARDFRTELDGLTPGPRRRVLCWREATLDQGADLALAAFDALAPTYPDLSFDMAFRENRHEVPGVQQLAEKHANVNLFRFPYPEGISLARLIAESLCVVLPFRQLTIQPQLAIAESLQAGAATVCTDIESCGELVRHEHTGLVVPPNDHVALTAAVAQLLDNREATVAMCHEAECDMALRWNWNTYRDNLIKLYQGLLDSID